MGVLLMGLGTGAALLFSESTDLETLPQTAFMKKDI